MLRIARLLLSHVHPIACAATAMPLACFGYVNAQVISTQWMSVLAFFVFCHSERSRSLLIFASSYCFKMGRVDTRFISTKVVKLHSVGDRATKLLVHPSMSHHARPTNALASISARKSQPLPHPATGVWVNLVHRVSSFFQAGSMVPDKPNRQSFDISISSVTAFREWGRFSTTTHAQPRRVGPLSFWGSLLDKARKAMCRISINYRIAFSTVVDRLGSWHFESSSDSRCRHAGGCL